MCTRDAAQKFLKHRFANMLIGNANNVTND